MICRAAIRSVFLCAVIVPFLSAVARADDPPHSYAIRLVRIEGAVEINVSDGDVLGPGGRGVYRATIRQDNASIVPVPDGYFVRWHLIGVAGSESVGTDFIVDVPAANQSKTPFAELVKAADETAPETVVASNSFYLSMSTGKITVPEPVPPGRVQTIIYSRSKIRLPITLPFVYNPFVNRTFEVLRAPSIRIHFDAQKVKIRFVTSSQIDELTDGQIYSPPTFVNGNYINPGINSYQLEVEGIAATSHDGTPVQVDWDFSVDKQTPFFSPNESATDPIFDHIADGAADTRSTTLTVFVLGGPLPQRQENPGETRGARVSGDRRGHRGIQPQAGSPNVYYSTGEAHVVMTDFNIQYGAEGFDTAGDIPLQRSWRSGTDRTTYLGSGWTMSWIDERIEESAAGVYVHTAAGRADKYLPLGAPHSDPVFGLVQDYGATASGFYDHLTRTITQFGNATSGWRRVTRDGVIWNYDATGHVTQTRDRFNFSLFFTYDSQSRLTGVGGGGMGYTFEYDTAKQLLKKVTDFRGRTADYLYDANNQLETVRLTGTMSSDPDRRSFTKKYGYLNGKLATIKDAKDQVRLTLGYGGDGTQVTTESWDGGTAGNVYNGNSVTVTDRRQKTATYTFAGTDLVQSNIPLETGVNAVGAYAYEDAARPREATRIDLPEGGRVVQAFDDRGNLTSRARSEGGNGVTLTDTYEHDTFEKYNVLLLHTDSRGIKHKYEYTADGRIFTETHNFQGQGQAAVTRSFYQFGSVNRVDPDGAETQYGFHPASGRLGGWAMYGGFGGTSDAQSSYNYDFTGQLLQSVRRPGYGVTYDSINDVNYVVEQETELFSNIVSVHTYDANYNRTRTVRTYPGGSTDTIVREFNAYDQLKTLTETVPGGTGKPDLVRVTTYEYDTAGNLTKVNKPNDRSVTTTYSDDARALPSKVTTGGGTGDLAASADVTTIFDRNGRTKTVTDERGVGTITEYDFADRVVKVTRVPIGGGPGTYTETNYGPDGKGDTITVTTKTAGGTTLAQTVSIIDALGRVANETRTGGGTTADGLPGTPDGVTVNEYFPSGRLKKSTRTLEGATTAFREYTYTGMGTLLTSTDEAKFPTKYQYSREGDRTLVTDANDVSTTYAYQTGGRLLAFVSHPLRRLDYVYDSRRNRIRETRTEGGEVMSKTEWDWDGFGRPITTRRYQLDANSAVLTSTTEYDLNGNVLKEIPPSGNATHATVYVRDGLERPKTITDPAGNVTTSTYVNNQLKTTEPPPSVSGTTGPKTTFCYDTLGRLETSTTTGGSEGGYRKTTYGYDDLDRKTSETITDGDTNNTVRRKTTWSYDLRGFVRKETRLANPGSGPGSLDQFSRTDYDAGGRARVMANALGSSSATYDPRDLPLTQTDATNLVTVLTYDKLGRLKTRAEPGQPAASFDYDSLNRSTVVTSPSGEVTMTDYTGRTTTVTSFGGAPKVGIVKTVVNGLGAAVSTTQVMNLANGNLGTGDVGVAYGYDQYGRLTTATDTRSKTTTYSCFDDLDRARKTVSEGGETQLGFDSRGNIQFREEFRPGGDRYSFVRTIFDGLDRPVQVNRPWLNPNGRLSTDQQDRVTKTDLDATDLPLKVTDPEGKVTKRCFDGFGLARTVTEDEGAGNTNRTTTFGYDRGGNLTCRTDANGNSTVYGRDPEGRPTSTTYAGTDGGTITYDPAKGLPLYRTDGRGWLTIYSYDGAGRLTNKSTVADDLTTYEDNFIYDGAGRLWKAERFVDVASVAYNEFVYDNLGRVKEEKQRIGAGPLRSVKFDYDAAGNRNRLEYPDGRKLDFTFDGDNRMLQVQENATGRKLIEYSYNELDRRGTRKAFKDDTNSTLLNTVTYGYNTGRDLTCIDSRNAAGQCVIGFEWGLTRGGGKTYELRRHAPEKSQTYGEDRLYRLTNFKEGLPDCEDPSVIPVPTRTRTWTLDALGNWDAVAETGYGAVHELRPLNDPLNQVREIARSNDDNRTNGYDDNGNRSQTKGDWWPSLTWKYEYDEENRLVKYEQIPDDRDNGDYVIITQEFDALGRRVRWTVEEDYAEEGSVSVLAQDEVRFSHDGAQIIEERDGGDVQQRQYIWGTTPDELLIQDGFTNGNRDAALRRYALQDSLNSVVALLRPDGSVEQIRYFDPYGKNTYQLLPVPGQPNFYWGVYCPFGYTGQRNDGWTGFYHYKAREFDPDTGTFLQRDPTGYANGSNLYEYVSSRPATATDPSGNHIFLGVDESTNDPWLGSLGLDIDTHFITLLNSVLKDIPGVTIVTADVFLGRSMLVRSDFGMGDTSKNDDAIEAVRKKLHNEGKWTEAALLLALQSPTVHFEVYKDRFTGFDYRRTTVRGGEARAITTSTGVPTRATGTVPAPMSVGEATAQVVTFPLVESANLVTDAPKIGAHVLSAGNYRPDYSSALMRTIKGYEAHGQTGRMLGTLGRIPLAYWTYGLSEPGLALARGDLDSFNEANAYLGIAYLSYGGLRYLEPAPVAPRYSNGGGTLGSWMLERTDWHRSYVNGGGSLGSWMRELSESGPRLNYNHIARGEVNNSGNAVGFHHRPGGIDPPSARMIQMISAPNAQGVYRGRVEVLNHAGVSVPKGPASSFFPDSWLWFRLFSEIQGAYRGRYPTPGKPSNYWEGVSPSGARIGGYLSPDGSINTAFPIY